MFDVGFWEIAVIAVVALVILGPERLPRAARTAGLWISKARRTVRTMKAEIERELDMEEMKKVVGTDTVETLQEFKQEIKEVTSSEEIKKVVGKDTLSSLDELSKEVKEVTTIDQKELPAAEDLNLKAPKLIDNNK